MTWLLWGWLGLAVTSTLAELFLRRRNLRLLKRIEAARLELVDCQRRLEELGAQINAALSAQAGLAKASLDFEREVGALRAIQADGKKTVQ